MKIFLIDAYALIFKYYYAFINRPMRNSKGDNTSIIFCFLRFIKEILQKEHPDFMGVAFDLKGGSFRNELYPEYKANRPETPEDILKSTPILKSFLQALNIPILEKEGFEADDIIGTLSHKAEEAGYDVYMVTPDKDYGQLVTNRVRIYKQKDDKTEILDSKAICEEYGIPRAELVSDILAIWGDASDNIPGVPGIGKKGASKLVAEWGDVEKIIESRASLPEKTRMKIESSMESLRLAKTLTLIRRDVEIELSEEELKIGGVNSAKLDELCLRMGFRTLSKELQETFAMYGNASSSTLFTSVNSIEVPTVQNPTRGTFVPPKNRELTLFDMLSSAPSDNTVSKQYISVEDNETMKAMCARFESEGFFSYMLLGTSSGISTGKIIAATFSSDKESSYFVSLARHAEFVPIIRTLFENEKIIKIGHAIKRDVNTLRREGIRIEGEKMDLQLMHYLLYSENANDLPSIVMYHIQKSIPDISDIIGRSSNKLSLSDVPEEKLAQFCHQNVTAMMELYPVLKQRLYQTGCDKLYLEIEEPLIDVLSDMEWEGISIDTLALARYGQEIQQNLQKIEQTIRNLSDEPLLNVNSPKQLGEVLFSKMKIAAKPKLTITKNYCTDEDYLSTFAADHEIIRHILEYRGIKKLLSTYIEALPLLVDRKTGRIHTTFNQAQTATGRLSSSNPNLQNIPIRDAGGRPIRASFIPSSKDRILLSADYSQIELRIMAHFSEDSNLISAFLSGEDIHTSTAARIYHRTLSEVTPDERRKAKTANFGIIYGISATGLAQRLYISREEARNLIEGYFQSYPGVKQYMEQVTRLARTQGYVETLFGRRRYLPQINSSNHALRSLAERNAINAPIQGTAADIMKKAMIGVWNAMRKENLRSRVVLQVHDELIVDTLAEEEARVRQILVEQMQQASQLRVPLLVECGQGQNWLEAH